MKTFFEGLVLSFGFFSIFRIPYTVNDINEKHYGYMATGLLFVALVLSVTTVFIYIGVSKLITPIYGAVFASLFYLFLYGFLHLEAVADIIDAYFAAHSGKDVREVLKDPSVGAMGAIGVFVFIFFKVSAISYILYNSLFSFFIISVILSRFCAVVLLKYGSFHKESKLAILMQEGIEYHYFLPVAALIFFTGIYLAPAMIVSIFLWGIFLYGWISRNIGFLNGDGLGFFIEMQELMLLNISLIFYL